MAFRSEFNLSAFIETIWRANKDCYLPVLTSTNTLDFIQYQPNDLLQTNRYGILEPQNTSNKIAAAALDIVLVPLLAFDRRGARLGTGGGYYDKTFAFLKTAPAFTSNKKPFLLGVAYAAQYGEQLPADTWDIKLAGVMTEQEIWVV